MTERQQANDDDDAGDDDAVVDGELRRTKAQADDRQEQRHKIFTLADERADALVQDRADKPHFAGNLRRMDGRALVDDDDKIECERDQRNADDELCIRAHHQ